MGIKLALSRDVSEKRSCFITGDGVVDVVVKFIVAFSFVFVKGRGGRRIVRHVGIRGEDCVCSSKVLLQYGDRDGV